jgi:hypothetical protein
VQKNNNDNNENEWKINFLMRKKFTVQLNYSIKNFAAIECSSQLLLSSFDLIHCQ